MDCGKIIIKHNYNQVLLYLQELTNKHAEKKQAYDTAAAGLESNMAKLEQVGSVTDGFVPQSIGVTINPTKFFLWLRQYQVLLASQSWVSHKFPND